MVSISNSCTSGSIHPLETSWKLHSVLDVFILNIHDALSRLLVTLTQPLTFLIQEMNDNRYTKDLVPDHQHQSTLKNIQLSTYQIEPNRPSINMTSHGVMDKRGGIICSFAWKVHIWVMSEKAVVLSSKLIKRCLTTSLFLLAAWSVSFLHLLEHR